MPGGTGHQDIRIDRIAHDALRDRIGVECLQVVLANRITDGGYALADSKVGIAPAHEVAGRHLGRVDQGARVAPPVGYRGFG